MLFSLAMESNEDGESWMEDQWEKWLTHDISLSEYEDEDLSDVTEITDENGVSLNHSHSALNIKDHVTRPANGVAGSAERRMGVAGLQAEMLHLDLIDAVGGFQEEEDEEDSLELIDAIDGEAQEEEDAAPPVGQPTLKHLASVAMDTYRPKRPTTLNLFPQAPRTQDTINNNSFGEKERRKEKVTHSSSPHITGELTPTHEQVCLSDGAKVQPGSRTEAKPRGTSSTQRPGEPHRKRKDKPSSTSQDLSEQTAMRETAGDVTREEGSMEKVRYHSVNGCREQVRYAVENGGTGQTHYQPLDYHRAEGGGESAEPGEEVDLTPERRDPERPSRSQSSDSNRMSVSSDAELPPHYQPLLGRANPSISEEDEVYPPTPPCRTVSLSEASEAGRGASGVPRSSVRADATGLSYDSVKYTLVVDEHAQLELVSLKQCYEGYDSDSDNTVYESAIDEEEEEEEIEDDDEEAGAGGMKSETSGLSGDTTTDTTSDVPRSRKFLNVFMNKHSRFSGADTFGLFSCVMDGEEREQSHRAVFRFVPRHDDELELEADDPLMVEVQAEDLWCEAYNMRTGSRGIFPAFYAVKVTKEAMQAKEKEKGDSVDTFWVKFLGSVQVPFHKGNDVLCAAMQKIVTNRRTMQFSPPSACILEINAKGVKIIVQDDCRTIERGDQCCHFFQLKNISFCGCHPKNSKYFGFITKHPEYQRFACHVFFSEDSTTPLAESVGAAFQQFYKEHMAYSCPTEDIFLE